jgi:hypothetical protein
LQITQLKKHKKISKRKLPFCFNDIYNTRMQTFYRKVPHACRTMGSCNLGSADLARVAKSSAGEFHQFGAMLTKPFSAYTTQQ